MKKTIEVQDEKRGAEQENLKIIDLMGRVMGSLSGHVAHNSLVSFR